MPRIPRVRRLQPFNLALSTPSTPNRASFAISRALSTCPARSSKSTEWVRGKVWSGEAPGPEDPYKQRVEPEETSNLPEEALAERSRDTTPAAILASRLTLPPTRSEATAEAEVAAADPTYVPATTAAELEEIAPLDKWWEQPGHWDESNEFRGFGSAAKVVDKEVVEVYLRRAVVEVLALQETGSFPEWATKKWAEGSRAELDQALAVQIEVKDGKASLKGDASSVTSSLMSQSESAEVSEVVEAERMSLEEARETVKAWESSWKDLTLDDHVRFALRKRLYQLTGTLIPDAKLGAARTVKHLLTLASKQPQPKRLAEVLERRDDLQQLGNVKVHSRRIGPIDKEVSVGRWKVIEEELRKRDLPVTGTGGMSKNKERGWLMGKY